LLYDALLALDLPSRSGPPLPTSLLDGVENLLFTGRYHHRRAHCGLSAAVVLARCLGLLRTRGARGLRVWDDADTLIEQEVALLPGQQPAPRWPEALPDAWTEQPCELNLRASLRSPGIRAVILLRYTPRHPSEQPTMTGALRLLWDAAPRAGAEEEFAIDLAASLPGAADLRQLARRLDAQGERLAQDLLQRLRHAFPGSSGSFQGRVVTLHGYGRHPERFADLLAGLPGPQREQLPRLECLVQQAGGRWPALDAQGVPGWLRGGSFQPSAEVQDAR